MDLSQLPTCPPLQPNPPTTQLKQTFVIVVKMSMMIFVQRSKCKMRKRSQIFNTSPFLLQFKATSIFTPKKIKSIRRMIYLGNKLIRSNCCSSILGGRSAASNKENLGLTPNLNPGRRIINYKLIIN